MADPESRVLVGLNESQRAAVLAVRGPVLILAGAGSGKTRVITHRLAHLVLDHGVPSEQILAVTFTNKAAGEMRSRVEGLLGGDKVGSWVLTFHGFCLRLLRRETAAAGLPTRFVVYDEDDQLALVRQVLRESELSEKLNPPRRLLARISARKNGVEHGRGGGEDGRSFDIDRLAARYGELLARAGAVDFDDLLLKGVAVLRDHEEVRRAWGRRFPYVLVDEYQDTNRAQYELVRLLCADHGNLTVVGDEDQAIYSWRGAEIRNILDFEADFPGAQVFRLERNYRSTQAILDAASALVAHNRRRKGKTLLAETAVGPPVLLHVAGDEYDEAAFAVERLVEHREGGRSAVLFRMNSQSRLLEEALLRHRIPYAVVGGIRFYERREVKDVLAYLRLLHNLDDPVALRRVINTPPRGIGARTLAAIDSRAAGQGVSPWEALKGLVDEAVLPARATQPLARFRDLIVALQQELPRLGVEALLERILEASGYSAALAEEDSLESQDRLDNLGELLSAAGDFETREADASLSGFLDRVALLTDGDLVRDDAPVVLMTLHAAKGLEFSTVVLIGLEEGLMPHSRSLAEEAGDGAALEEERRLCYVGMTRAMRRLYLTCAQTRSVFGERRSREPSRFLFELPEEKLARSGLPLRSFARSDWQSSAGQRRSRDNWSRGRTPVPPSNDPPGVRYEPEGAGLLRPGDRVRHPLFGAGTVLRCEGSGGDAKLTVSFPGIGAKRLVARYAGLVAD